MSIKYAILGLLSWKPSTGYEMKKVFEESSTMYWSGNNNQIYKSLVQLLDEGLVTNETQHQDGSPSKKIYTITDDGLTELREWILSTPEAPEFKKTFLIQLAWAHQINDGELNGMLIKYENEVKMQLLLQQEKVKRGLNSPKRNAREVFMWNMISENSILSYKCELDWIQRVRKELFGKQIIEERNKMDYSVNGDERKKFIEVTSTASELTSENDALDLIALCGENETNLLMLHGNVLSEDFFRLKTGVAGKMLQKFVNYRVKTAVILPDQANNKGRFKEMVSEANKGNHFRVFENKADAEKWLMS